MTRPIHIDSMINERIIPKDVVAYIEQIEAYIEEQQEMLSQADSMYVDLLLEIEGGLL